MVATNGDRAVVVEYDPDACEEVCECVGRIAGFLAATEVEFGTPYADQYQRRLFDLIEKLRVDERARGWSPGLPMSVDGMRRALRQPTSAEIPDWQVAPPSSASGPL